ncbi:hypothetical protein MRX96_041305 [Rhipicephalus microplus]
MHLWKVIRLLLILSHGQATVERGFSVNRQVSVENLKDIHTLGLDEFYLELLKGDSSYMHLWKVIRLLLILSHGQATVERGFSINRQVSVENLKDISTIVR